MTSPSRLPRRLDLPCPEATAPVDCLLTPAPTFIYRLNFVLHQSLANGRPAWRGSCSWETRSRVKVQYIPERTQKDRPGTGRGVAEDEGTLSPIVPPGNLLRPNLRWWVMVATRSRAPPSSWLGGASSVQPCPPCTHRSYMRALCPRPASLSLLSSSSIDQLTLVHQKQTFARSLTLFPPPF